jgi:adenine-specific DNA-methyltransferase
MRPSPRQLSALFRTVGRVPVSLRQKALGAFYTPAPMAAALVDWAIRTPNDTVLDPSFGGLAFLSQARRRLEDLGAPQPAQQLHGADLDPVAFDRAAGLADEGARLVRRDFLRLSPGKSLPRATAVVGNPPYVRYQSVKARQALGRDLAAQKGLRLSRLASSWAPLLLHAADFVADGGRLAQVLPAELIHAQYAHQILDHICERFDRVSVAMFEDHVFPGAQEEVVLLCAEGRGAGGADGVEILSFKNLGDLQLSTASGARRRQVGPHKLLAGLLDPAALEVYDELAGGERTRRLGQLASIDIGAVTGANSFFVRPGNEVKGVPAQFLRDAVSKAAHIQGARLGKRDLRDMDARGRPSRMLVLEPDAGRIDAVRRLIEEGEATGINQRYKCRIRDPWWVLPSSQVAGPPALFLTYMSAGFPRLAVNEAGALSTNSVHGVRLLNGTDPRVLAAGFYTSLTMLSAELVGRSYGGGVLKLEPTEAERLLVARPSVGHRDLLRRVDLLVRAREYERALDLVDRAVLVEDLGVAPEQVALLRSAAHRLRQRRLGRSVHRAQGGADLREHAV